MAPDGFALALIKGLSRCCNDKMNSSRVYDASLSFEQDRSKKESMRVLVLQEAVVLVHNGGLGQEAMWTKSTHIWGSA